MMSDTSQLSDDFRRVYCNGAVFDSFSAFHPISFKRVLPFQSHEQVVDDQQLLYAEETCLTDHSEDTRRNLLDEYLRCGLLAGTEATDLKGVVDFFGADFFEVMGEVYANAGMFRCALRWYRELIEELEARQPNLRSDEESVYASAGYCLYSLGLFEEAISWSKSCIGPRPMADAVCQSLIAYEVESGGGRIQRIERSASRTKYTINAPVPADVAQTVSGLKEAMRALAPFQDVYIDWVSQPTDDSGGKSEGYPFKAEFDAGSVVRHKMNLIFATCGWADNLIAKSYKREARRL